MATLEAGRGACDVDTTECYVVYPQKFAIENRNHSGSARWYLDRDSGQGSPRVIEWHSFGSDPSSTCADTR
ncbi:uncharacterized protein LOC143211881 isoform X4 [Lasioglossum baleicum]|uniref:uncharacterized protein LOC143211881 isoform X4 n=1 Tax=Lasioglossum baleicum TaxID=434251 RepID=UPI003FCE7C96